MLRESTGGQTRTKECQILVFYSTFSWANKKRKKQARKQNYCCITTSSQLTKPSVISAPGVIKVSLYNYKKIWQHIQGRTCCLKDCCDYYSKQSNNKISLHQQLKILISNFIYSDVGAKLPEIYIIFRKRICSVKQ